MKKIMKDYNSCIFLLLAFKRLAIVGQQQENCQFFEKFQS